MDKEINLIWKGIQKFPSKDEVWGNSAILGSWSAKIFSWNSDFWKFLAGKVSRILEKS